MEVEEVVCSPVDTVPEGAVVGVGVAVASVSSAALDVSLVLASPRTDAAVVSLLAATVVVSEVAASVVVSEAVVVVVASVVVSDV